MHHRKGSGRGKGRGSKSGSSSVVPAASPPPPPPTRSGAASRRSTKEVDAYGRRKMTGFRVKDAFRDLKDDYRPDGKKREEMNDYLDGLGGWEGEKYLDEFDSRCKVDIDLGIVKSTDPRNLYAPIGKDLTKREWKAHLKCRHEGGMDKLVGDIKAKIENNRRWDAESLIRDRRSRTDVDDDDGMSTRGKPVKRDVKTIGFLSSLSSLPHSDRTSSIFARASTFVETVPLDVNPYVFLESWMKTFYKRSRYAEDEDAFSVPYPFRVERPAICQIGIVFRNKEGGETKTEGQLLEETKRLQRKFCTSIAFANLKRFFEECVGKETFKSHLVLKDKFVSAFGKDYVQRKNYLPVLFSREQMESRLNDDSIAWNYSDALDVMHDKEYYCHSWDKLLPLDNGEEDDDDDDDDGEAGRSISAYGLEMCIFSEADLESIKNAASAPKFAPVPIIESNESGDDDYDDGKGKGKDKKKKKNETGKRKTLKKKKVSFLDQEDRAQRLGEYKKRGIDLIRTENDTTSTCGEPTEGKITMDDMGTLHLFDTNESENVRLCVVFFILKPL